MNNKDGIRNLSKKIVSEENLKPGDKLAYSRILSIAEKYDIDPKTLAVDIFKITPSQFANLKSKSKTKDPKATIFRNEAANTVKMAELQRDTIMENENLKPGGRISYKKIKYIAEKYDIPEKILVSNVLLIANFWYKEIKRDKTKTAIIFGNKKKENPLLAKDEKTEELREKILKTEKLKICEKINYDKIHELSVKYGIDEQKLAIDVFGISNDLFSHLKTYRKRKAVILKGYLDEEKIGEIYRKIIVNGLIKENTINYKKLKELSDKYLIDEKVMAMQILRLNQKQYETIKYDNGNAILKEENYEIFERKREKLLKKAKHEYKAEQNGQKSYTEDRKNFFDFLILNDKEKNIKPTDEELELLKYSLEYTEGFINKTYLKYLLTKTYDGNIKNLVKLEKLINELNSNVEDKNFKEPLREYYNFVREKERKIDSRDREKEKQKFEEK